MQHSYFIKLIKPSGPESKSYLEICQSVCMVLGRLANIDSVFSKFELSAAGSHSCSLEIPRGISDCELNVIAVQMANDLIEYERNDIARDRNECDPTIEYKSSMGVTRSLIFKETCNNRLEIRFSLGGDRPGSFNIDFIAKNKLCHRSMEWYEKVMKCLVDDFNPDYVGLIFATMDFIKNKN